MVEGDFALHLSTLSASGYVRRPTNFPRSTSPTLLRPGPQPLCSHDHYAPGNRTMTTANVADRDAVMAALATVNDPELHASIVRMGMVKDVVVEGGAVRLKLELTTPACPLRETIATDVRAALATVPGFESVTI